MAKSKPHSKQKGLSDSELVNKYESGRIQLRKAVKVMCATPSPTASPKSEKQTKKR